VIDSKGRPARHDQFIAAVQGRHPGHGERKQGSDAAPPSSKPIQFGLIAEEVAEVYPNLVAHSADGQIETVKYQVLDSMLLNEIQRQENQLGSQAEQITVQTDEILRLRQELRRQEERLSQLEAALAAQTKP
jgi:hypothetical protein